MIRHSRMFAVGVSISVMCSVVSFADQQAMADGRPNFSGEWV